MIKEGILILYILIRITQLYVYQVYLGIRIVFQCTLTVSCNFSLATQLKVNKGRDELGAKGEGGKWASRLPEHPRPVGLTPRFMHAGGLTPRCRWPGHLTYVSSSVQCLICDT